jgi:hypothetical protein
VANLSGVMGDMFRFVYSNLICFGCMKNRKGSDKDSSSNSELVSNRSDRSNSLGFNKRTFIDQNGELIESNEEKNESKKIFLFYFIANQYRYLFIYFLL